MRAFRTFLLTAIVLATTACASNTIKHQAAFSAGLVEPAPAVAAISQSNTSATPAFAMSRTQNEASTTGAAAHSVASAEDPGQAEQDAEAISAQQIIRDPWEGFNRKMHNFNNVTDKFILRPVAVGYKKITPEPVQAGVSRFFANLSMPVTAVNQTLQGRPGDAARSLGRFVVNTTIGIIGVFDPASSLGMSIRDGEDFGQTLAHWGWRDSRYLVLPLLGPRTLRDAVAIVGDYPLSPVGYVQGSGTSSGLQVLGIVDMRTRMLPIDEFRQYALDDYLFVRDAWAQVRNHQIQQDLRRTRD